MKGWLTAQKNN